MAFASTVRARVLRSVPKANALVLLHAPPSPTAGPCVAIGITLVAGGFVGKNSRHTSLNGAKSAGSRRYTWHFTISASDEPAAFNAGSSFCLIVYSVSSLTGTPFHR